MTELRPYQLKMLNDVRQKFKEGRRKVLLQAPTGSGKTIIAAHMIKGAIAMGGRVLFCVHRRELVKQSVNAFRSEGIDVGIIANQFDYVPGKRAYVASIPTLVRRLRYFRNFSRVIFDECHHNVAKSWDDCWQNYFDDFIIGLSATPKRLDRKALSLCFDSLVVGPKIKELIDLGFLADYKYYGVGNVDLSKVKTTAGDYNKKQLAEIMENTVITGNAIDHYERYGNDGQFLAFCASVAHSKQLAAAFYNAGIPAVHVDGGTPMEHRDMAMEEFRKGNIKILTNCNLFTEGVDVPSLDGIIMLRPTQSLTVHLQAIGRALRPSPGKEKAIILDHVGNHTRHGLPCDEHQWSLDGIKDKQRREMGIKNCPDCFLILNSYVRTCPGCGHVFVTVKRNEIEEVEGDLVELDKKSIIANRKAEERACKSEAEFIELGIRRGYEKPRGWAKHMIKNRERYAKMRMAQRK